MKTSQEIKREFVERLKINRKKTSVTGRKQQVLNFGDFIQSCSTVSYRRFGTTYRSEVVLKRRAFTTSQCCVTFQKRRISQFNSGGSLQAHKTSGISRKVKLS